MQARGSLLPLLLMHTYRETSMSMKKGEWLRRFCKPRAQQKREHRLCRTLDSQGWQERQVCIACTMCVNLGWQGRVTCCVRATCNKRLDEQATICKRDWDTCNELTARRKREPRFCHGVRVRYMKADAFCPVSSCIGHQGARHGHSCCDLKIRISQKEVAQKSFYKTAIRELKNASTIRPQICWS